MDQVIAPVGERLDQLRNARHADLEAGVEGDLDLGDGRQAAINPRVRADHLDLPAGHAVLANPVDRLGDAVHRPRGVDHQRHPAWLAVPGGQLRRLAAQEGGGRNVRNDGHAGVEHGFSGSRVAIPRDGRGRDAIDGLAQAPLVCPSGAPVELGVAETLRLHQLNQGLCR